MSYFFKSWVSHWWKYPHNNWGNVTKKKKRLFKFIYNEYCKKHIYSCSSVIFFFNKYIPHDQADQNVLIT